MTKNKKGRPKGSKKVATKGGEVYEAILYEDKPNCPKCGVRDYRREKQSLMPDKVTMKFYVQCNQCKCRFIYCKPLSNIFVSKKEDKNEICNL